MPPAQSNFSSRAGFSFLALSLAIVLVGAILAVGLPLGRKFLREHRAAKVAADLRAFAPAFQSFANEHGDWPPGDGVPGRVPPGMESRLSSTAWGRTSPVGGRYTWDPGGLQQGSRIRAAIVIASADGSAVTSDREQLLAIDRVIDDGDLAAGNFLLGYRNYPIFVLER